MQNSLQLKTIAKIHTPFRSKFGIPRQSGLVENVKAEIIFEPEYRNPDALRGLDGYSHIWVIWEFSKAIRKDWSPTVRPPRLGGNTRVGVFASRSPFRPNPLGLSSLRLEKIALQGENGPVLYVSGADLMDGTPIYDIKPYLPYVDCHTDASGGFALQRKGGVLEVDFPEKLANKVPQKFLQALKEILAQDPRPAYQNSPERVYGMEFYNFEIRFTVDENILTVCEVFKTGD